MQDLALYVAPKPLSPHLVETTIPPGSTVAAMLTEAVRIGALDSDDLDLVRVYVDGEPLPGETPEDRLAHLDLVPPAGSVINLAVEPEGQGQRARGTFQIIGQIAAFAAFFVPGIGPALSAGISLATAVGSAVLFKVGRPNGLPDGSDRGAISGQSNSIRKREMMPLQFGEGRAVLDVAALPYNQLLGDQSWIKVAFGLHYGPCVIGDIKIGETLLADYPAGEYAIELFLDPGPRVSTLYPAAVDQENLQDELTFGGDWEVHTTTTGCQRIEVDLTWPSGLRYTKDSGTTVPQETRLQFEWQPLDANGQPTGGYVAAPLEGGPYRNRQGQFLPTGTADVQARTNDPVRRTFAWETGGVASYNVRIKAWDPDADDASRAVQTVLWTALRSIDRRRQPIADENLSVLVLSLRSSEDLGGTLPTVTANIVPRAPVWTGSAWLDAIEDWEPSSNAAALARMMLVGPAAAEPHTADDFDASCEDVYELIEARGWTGSARLTGDTTQEDALRLLGAIGRFSVYDAGEGLCFTPDWSKPIPRQLFTGRNVQGYRYTRSFPPPCHGVIVEFGNSDSDGKADELIVYSDGINEASADLLETLTLPYACAKERAFREGRVWLAKRQLQVEGHEWTAGADAITATYGDRVKVRHATALYGLAEARVQHRHLSGALVAGVRLDEAVVMDVDDVYAIDVRRHDQVIPGIAVVTAPGRTRDLMFPTPLAASQAPEAGDLLAFGRVGAVTEDLEIIDIEPGPDDTATIRAISTLR